jgi:DNA-binding transcriptional MerR regulator
MREDESTVSLLSADQVRRLTTLSSRQLRYWDETGFFRPAHIGEPRERFGRVYSFEDLVGLRVIALMRAEVPLQELRRVGRWLHDHRGSWTGRTFWIRGKRVYWDDDEGLRIGTRRPDQVEMPIAMDKVTEDMRQAIARLRERSNQEGKVEKRRYTVGHEAVVAGTRIPTKAIWLLHRAGYDKTRIRKEYPRLTDRDVEAALEWEERQRAS